ncbi:unnamed protein product [Ixodes pacificus]
MAQHVRPSGARPVKMSAWTALPGSSALRKIIVPACFLPAVGMMDNGVCELIFLSDVCLVKKAA